MPLNAVDALYFRSDSARCEQGDIFRDIKLIEWAEEEADELKLAERTLQYCVLLSQDCDLEHDYNNRSETAPAKNDKFLHSLLLCPAYPAIDFRAGDHLKQLELKMESFNSARWALIEQNNNARYHYLPEDGDRQVPPLVLDFKHYLTAPRDVFYRQNFQDHYLATMNILYRENLSGRFAHYLSRIGLPDMASA